MGLSPSETGRRVLHGTPLSAINGSESVRCIVSGSAELGPPALCPLIIRCAAADGTRWYASGSGNFCRLFIHYYYDILGECFSFPYRPLGPFYLFAFNPCVNGITRWRGGGCVGFFPRQPPRHRHRIIIVLNNNNIPLHGRHDDDIMKQVLTTYDIIYM